MCRLIDGIAIAAEIRSSLRSRTEILKKKGVVPHLAVILAGDNPASEIYVRKKIEACKDVGILSTVIRPEEWMGSSPQSRLEAVLWSLNDDDNFHGVLVQLPLPLGHDLHRVFDLIPPEKDVDVFNPVNVGKLVQGRSLFKPCTPHAIQHMLSRSGVPIAGKHVAVINRSDVVGKPLSSMLIQNDDDFANATVTICHDRTPHVCLKRTTRDADIVVVAVGKPDFLTADMISPGCTVVDVGINRINGKVVGDAHANCKEVAACLTPVPGGVGPVTVAMLLENTVKSAERSAGS